MKLLAYILLVTTATLAGTACEHAHPGGYEAPVNGKGSRSFNEDVVVKIDSSVEKAIANDTTKRVYTL
ncbi:MAG TPA: hypothetical protein VK174_00700 [Chitinophagales bacterium]|nr:hypothetical protein [Chitinophagales bacterium]